MRQADFASSVAFAKVLFWVLLPVVLFAPKKWAVATWFLMGNLDASGGQFEGTAAYGAINAFKAIVLPAYLIWRLRSERGVYLLSTSWAKIWIAFVVWVGVASLWSPFPISAAKAVVYLIGLLLGLLVFERAGRAGLLDSRFIVIALGGTLVMGLIQQFVFLGEGFGFEVSGTRFTAFIGAQAYAAGLVALLCAVLTVESFSPSARAACAIPIFVALFFNGSRTWALGAALAIVVLAALTFGRRPIATVIVAVVVPSVVMIGTVAFGPSSLVGDDPDRIASAIRAMSESEGGLGSIQNVAFRYRIWGQVMSSIEDGSSRDLLLGHGTSSAAEVGIRAAPHVFATKSLDANRVMHNEWLRAAYEWGLFGLALWTLAYAMAVAGLIRMYVRTRSQRLIPILAFFPALTIATFTENIMMGAGTATITGLLLLVGLAFQNQPEEMTAPAPGLS